MPDGHIAPSPRRPSPGRYDDMMIEEYLATEAMGQEFAKNIVERAPRYAWFHSAFNPAFSPTVDRKLEFGSAIRGSGPKRNGMPGLGCNYSQSRPPSTCSDNSNIHRRM